MLTIAAPFSRFSPAVDARFSYRGEDVVLTLERVCATVGYPSMIRVDQGSEYVSRDLDLWAYQKSVVLDMEAWRRDDNEVLPHSAIGHKPPMTLLNGSRAPVPA